MSGFTALGFAPAFYVAAVDPVLPRPTPGHDCEATGREWFASWQANGWLWPVKFDQERVTVQFDFSKDLSFSDKVSSVQLIVTVMRGTDPAPAALLYGQPAVKGTRVFQKLAGGVAGCSYKVLCRVTTLQNDVLQLAGVLPVQSL